MASTNGRPFGSDGIINVTHAAIRGVTAICWLGILAAACALPVVYFDRSWLHTSIETSVAHGSNLFLHFSLGLVAIALLLAIGLVFLRHLERFVRAVSSGHFFAHGHALRLRRMAWLMLVMELLSILIGAYATWMGPDFAWMEIGGGLSITGLIAVLMLFVMARVFAVGAAMREDLDGVV
ncbi:hypothetical protein M2412_000956 [Stenotrophomonas rhizophila]|uniref:DUF2975 domain-containing protein n=1 Tax=Stenotrophomonas rhizophila TaxID=216778 RepID=A0AAW5PEZ5_9GAMM|nr:hypothetical protein [Stenotrophomonas rhizophila]